MSAINQQHKIQVEFMRKEIKEVTTKIKRLDFKQFSSMQLKQQ